MSFVLPRIKRRNIATRRVPTSFLIFCRERTFSISTICRSSVTISTLLSCKKESKSAASFPKRKLIQRFVSMTTRTCFSDCFDLGRDLRHCYRRVLELLLDAPHFFEKRLVVEIARESLLVLPGKTIDQFFDLRQFQVKLYCQVSIRSSMNHIRIIPKAGTARIAFVDPPIEPPSSVPEAAFPSPPPTGLRHKGRGSAVLIPRPSSRRMGSRRLRQLFALAAAPRFARPPDGSDRLSRPRGLLPELASSQVALRRRQVVLRSQTGQLLRRDFHPLG